jgi:hypothetical protein
MADSLESFSMPSQKADNGIVLNLGWDKTREAVHHRVISFESLNENVSPKPFFLCNCFA